MYDYAAVLFANVFKLKAEGKDNTKAKETLFELIRIAHEERARYKDISPGTSLEEMGKGLQYRIGSKELSRALRWEVQRQLNDDPPAQSESNVQVSERIRPEVRAVLIQRGLLRPDSDYPSIDMLRRLVGKLR